MKNYTFKLLMLLSLSLGLNTFTFGGPLRKLAVGMGILSAGAVNGALHYQQQQIDKQEKPSHLLDALENINKISKKQRAGYKCSPSQTVQFLCRNYKNYYDMQDKINNIDTKRYEFLEQAYQREIEHAQEYYAFYHSQPGKLKIIHDVSKKMVEWFNARDLSCHDFEYLRAPEPEKEASVYDRWQHIDDFYEKELVRYKRGDTNFIISKNLLSTTLYLFGKNWYVYKQNYGHLNPNVDLILKDLFHGFGFSSEIYAKYLTRLNELNWQYNHAHASFFQILLPKNSVEDVSYIAQDFGFKYNKDNSRVSLYLEKISTNEDFLYNRCRKYRSYPDIEPEARLLINNKVLLNPDSGIKIFRYDQRTAENKALYEQQLKLIIRELMNEVIEQVDFVDKFGHTKLAVVQRYNDLFKQEFTRWNRPEDKALFGLHANHTT